MEFLSHLEELRRRIIICLIAFFIATLASWFFSHALLDFLTEPLRASGIETQLVFQKPYEAFLVHLKIAALAGVFIASPVFFLQLWLFVAPGLYPHERKIVLQLAVASLGLFLLGAGFAYKLVLPTGLHFFLSFQTEMLRPLLSVGHYFSFLTNVVLGFGLLFNVPLFLIGLVKLGVLKIETLIKARGVVVVIIFILAAVFTPPDPLTQIMLAVPLWGLFEISVWLARFFEPKDRREAQKNPNL